MKKIKKGYFAGRNFSHFVLYSHSVLGMRQLYLPLLLLLTCSTVLSLAKKRSQGTNIQARTKNGRFLSIFNVVTFKNSVCSGASSTSANTVYGKCLPSSECDSTGNSNADGSCASGFGVCCVFAISSCTATVTENCTYIQNEGYPSPVTAASQTCITTIRRPSNCNICQIRLDFETLVTTADADGDCNSNTVTTADGLTVTSPFSSSTAAFPPTICGTLTGQHMYFESGSSGSSSFTIATGTGTANRMWRIKVSMIECTNLRRAPSGCHQYLTGTTGVVQSYGFESSNQLRNQRTTACVRQESGMCSIQWAQNPAVTDGFAISTPTTATETTAATCAIAATHDAYITLDGTTICGSIFSAIDAHTLNTAVISTTLPFRLSHFTGSTFDLSPYPGFSLAYSQIPCT